MNIGEELLIDYLSGELDTAQQQEVEQELERNESLRMELESLKLLKADMEGFTGYMPSQGLKNNFQAMLEAEKKRLHPEEGTARIFQLKKWRRSIISAAAILVIGIFAGLQVQTYRIQRQQIAAIQAELEATRQQMNALLSTESTSKRIQAVNMSMDLPKADQEVIDQLIELIHKDESANVRLAAVDALIQFEQGASIQQALTSALRIEEKPVVQIAIIHALIKIKATEALPALDELIEKDQTLDKVKDEARLGKFKLS